ncbi:hypothetical protein LOTGIDRAFT_154248 [Lottia gigantea]|uniref:Homeobox domain-containing protein n=1 Tax=Lottia gigantea TaxID=225164 RepID=V4A794_LOTGI|nr:hypothetical protein LOTGIDRAFT_154248 [Lottia gigantea]ESO89161.1 hypothetical protein LOTGIDRAFT_154248 [Lottia gigantea]
MISPVNYTVSSSDRQVENVSQKSGFIPYQNQLQYTIDSTSSYQPTFPSSFYQPWDVYNSPHLETNFIRQSSVTIESPVSRDGSIESHLDLDSSPSSSRYSTTPTTTPPLITDSDSGNSSGFVSDSSPQPATSSSPNVPPPISTTDLGRKLSDPEKTTSKKNSRTNYSPQQVRSLEKIFLDTPYPESEVMEQLSRDLDIPEKNLKIWFQNKRARWRKRVRDNKPAFPPMNPSYIPPVATNITQYSMMSPSALMSQVLPSGVASRPVYNIPSSIPTPSNTTTFQRAIPFPTYVNSYMYPQFR